MTHEKKLSRKVSDAKCAATACKCKLIAYKVTKDELVSFYFRELRWTDRMPSFNKLISQCRKREFFLFSVRLELKE